MGSIFHSGIQYLGSGITPIELTKAEYDALPTSEKENPAKVYYVKDYDPSPADIIDDTTTASDKVWSSSKVSSEIANAKGWKAVATAASNQTWKAQLESLKPYFMALTNDEKLSCVLQVGGWAICSLIDVTTGGFFRTNAACTVVVYYMNYSGAGKYVNNGTDQSTTVNTETLTLLQQK